MTEKTLSFIRPHDHPVGNPTVVAANLGLLQKKHTHGVGTNASN